MTFFKTLALLLTITTINNTSCMFSSAARRVFAAAEGIAKFSDVWSFEEERTVKYGNAEFTVSQEYEGFIIIGSRSRGDVLRELHTNSTLKSLRCINLPSLEKNDRSSLPLIQNRDGSYRLETTFLIDKDNNLLDRTSTRDLRYLIDPSSFYLIDPSSDEAKTAWAEIDAGAELTILGSAEGK